MEIETKLLIMRNIPFIVDNIIVIGLAFTALLYSVLNYRGLILRDYPTRVMLVNTKQFIIKNIIKTGWPVRQFFKEIGSAGPGLPVIFVVFSLATLYYFLVLNGSDPLVFEKVSITMSKTTKGAATVYFNVPDDKQQFDSRYKYFLEMVSDGRLRSYEVDLPNYKVEQIRLDPGSKAGEVEFASIHFTLSLYGDLYYTTPDMTQNLEVVNHLVRVPGNSLLQFKTNGDSPIILIPVPTITLPIQILHKVLLSVLAFLVIFLFGYILRVLQKPAVISFMNAVLKFDGVIFRGGRPNNTLVKTNKFIVENIITIGLSVTFLVTVVLRFSELTFQSYWVDELLGLILSDPDLSFWEMYSKSIDDVHPPLFQMVLWLWINLFGFTEYVGRSLSAVFGVFGVFAVYLLGKEFFNKEVGLYATMIASVNYFLIYYSQEVRSYGLLCLFSTLSYLCFFKLFTTFKKKDLAVYLLVTAALLYTHYFGFFLVMTQAVVFAFFFIQEKGKRRELLKFGMALGVGIIIAIAPLLGPILEHSHRTKFWIGKPSKLFFVSFMQSYVNSHYLEGIFLFLIALSLIFLFRKSANKKHKTVTIVLLIWIVFGYLLPYIRSVTSTPLLVDRYTIIVLPAFMLLSAYGVFLLRYPSLKIAAIAVVMFFSGHQLIQSEYYTKAHKQQFREILIEIPKGTEKIPAYAFLGVYLEYQKMLHLDVDLHYVDVYSTGSFGQKLKNGSLEKCFWAMDGHSDYIGPAKFMQNKDLTIVHVINKYGTSGVLYSYKTPPQECAKLYPHIKPNPDRGFNRHGAWY